MKSCLLLRHLTPNQITFCKKLHLLLLYLTLIQNKAIHFDSVVCDFLYLTPIVSDFVWFQHQRALEDPAAQRYSFYQVVSANQESPSELRFLQHSCLNPGLYAAHLERWLSHYPPNQVHTIP